MGNRLEAEPQPSPGPDHALVELVETSAAQAAAGPSLMGPVEMSTAKAPAGPSFIEPVEMSAA
jgi:hypothetical protein